jgi:adenosylcobyric acid synthase
VELVYSLKPSDIEGADMIIIPGSKNTIKDLITLRETGVEESIKKAALKGIPLVGICGGYQMLGMTIKDPHGVEGVIKETAGFGLLDVETVLEKTKTTTQVQAWEHPDVNDGEKIRGYEIHMGATTGDTGLFKIKRFTTGETVLDGSIKNNVWGTYIHGIFDNDSFRGRLLNGLRKDKGFHEIPPVDYSLLKEQAMDRLAGIIEANLDMKYIKALLCLPG